MTDPPLMPGKRLLFIHPAYALPRAALPSLISRSRIAYLRLHTNLHAPDQVISALTHTNDLNRVHYILLDEVDTISPKQLEALLVRLLNQFQSLSIILIGREWPPIFQRGMPLRQLVQLWPVDHRVMLIDYVNTTSDHILSAFSFGTGHILHNGHTLALKPESQRLLLYLLNRRGAVTRSEVFADLWPQHSVAAQRYNLATARTAINSALGLEFVQTSHNLLCPHPAVEIHQDTRKYEHIIHKAFETIDEPDWDELRLADRLYRRPFLLHLNDIWAQKQRHELLDLRTDHLKWLAQYHLSHGRSQQALTSYLRAFVLHPLRDDVLYEILKLYDKLKKPCAALRMFHRFVDKRAAAIITPDSALHQLVRDLEDRCRPQDS